MAELLRWRCERAFLVIYAKGAPLLPITKALALRLPNVHSAKPIEIQIAVHQIAVQCPTRR